MLKIVEVKFAQNGTRKRIRRGVSKGRPRVSGMKRGKTRQALQKWENLCFVPSRTSDEYNAMKMIKL